jgi:hypothetical protein
MMPLKDFGTTCSVSNRRRLRVSKKRRVQAAVTACAAIAALLVGAQGAMADASGHASCVGIETSSVSPPGSSTEFRGGVPELVQLVQGAGGPPGATVSFVAKLHEGSHAACDEATEG